MSDNDHYANAYDRFPSDLRSKPRGQSLMRQVRDALVDPGREELVVAGRVVLTPDGKPIRSILTGRKRRTTGSYASRKGGCGQVFESMIERAFFIECEVDTHVVDYRAQPFRIEVVIDGRLRTYIADCVRLMADGSIEVVEVKGSARQLLDPEYEAKLAAVRSVCASAGWQFKIITGDQITTPTVRYKNIEDIQLSKHVRYGAEATGGNVERSSAQANLEVAIKIGTYGEISIPYPRQVEFHSRCDYLQSLGRQTRGRPQKGMRVLAPSGSGKTSAAEAYIRLVEARMPSTATFKPIVLVPLDRATTSKKLFSSILSKFGDGFSDKGSEVVLKQRAVACFQRFQSQLLIIDEVQHLNYPSSATNDVTDTLKTLLDAGVLPIVFLGTEEAEGMFARNLQLNGRLLPPCDFKPLRATSAEDRELLSGYWERLENEIVERKLLPTHSRLSQALAVIGGSHKPVGPILHAALSGGLPEGLRGQRFRGLLSRVFIHRSVADDIALRAVSGAPQVYSMGEAEFGAYWSSVMSRTEAEELLNCSPPDFNAVRAEGYLLSAPGFQSAIATRHVLDFGASFISTREISRLTKLEVRGVDKEMKRLGHDRRCAGFWSRQDVYGPNGLLSSLRSNRRIFGVWDAAQFGLPIQACSGFRVDDAPEAEKVIRFAEKARLLFGTGPRINVSSAVERSA